MYFKRLFGYTERMATAWMGFDVKEDKLIERLDKILQKERELVFAAAKTRRESNTG